MSEENERCEKGVSFLTSRCLPSSAAAVTWAPPAASSAHPVVYRLRSAERRCCQPPLHSLHLRSSLLPQSYSAASTRTTDAHCFARSNDAPSSLRWVRLQSRAELAVRRMTMNTVTSGDSGCDAASSAIDARREPMSVRRGCSRRQGERWCVSIFERVAQCCSASLELRTSAHRLASHRCAAATLLIIFSSAR